MQHDLTDRARRVLTLAADEARRMNHQYIGTEHILLGLLAEGAALDAEKLGLGAARVREKVEELVQRGPDTPVPGELPMTPRAKRAIEIACDEASMLGLAQIDIGQLLVGLIREPDGVAGLVMLNLGVNLEQLRAHAYRLRLSQMRLVERVVRPVRSGTAGKRAMREELLGHLTAIYQEELAQSNDPATAMRAAEQRFGDPAELSRELDRAVPPASRREFHFQRYFGWRAPESVARMMARAAVQSFCMVAILMSVPIVAGIIYQGWDSSQAAALRVFAALLLLTPLTQFVLGIFYYRMRDSLFGAFGSRRSAAIATLWAAGIALAGFASTVGFVAIVQASIQAAREMLTIAIATGFAAAAVCAITARLRGLNEIRDANWALLNLMTPD